MPGTLQRLLLFPLRRPGRTLLAGALLGLSAGLVWYAVTAWRFHRDRAQAAKALAEYDFASARQLLERCVQQRPRDPEVRLLAAQAARRDGDLDPAEAHLDVYRQLVGAPTSDGALEWAMLQAQRGRVHEVVNDLIASLEVRHPASEQILEALAMGCVQVYQLERARFWIQELLARHPNNPTGRLLLAQTAESLGNTDKALAALRDLVADRPQHTKARESLAETLYRSLEYEEAGTHYAELCRQQPGQVKPLLGLARCRYRQGLRDEARPLLRRLQEQFPNDSEVLLECGRFAMGEERLEDAEPLVRRALELSPHDHEALYVLGVCLQQQGRPEEASRYLDRFKQIEADLVRLEQAFEAVARGPADPAPRLEAGEICLRNGQEAEGVRWLQGALEVFPSQAAAHQAVAEVCERAGRPDLAAGHRRLAEGGAVVSPFAGPAPGSPRRP